MFRDSVEIDELKYPIRVRELRVRPDSEGAGRRRGAPGTRVAYGPKRDPMTAAYVTDGHHHPPRGTRGGGDGAPSIPFRVQDRRRRGAAAADLAGGHRARRAARSPAERRRRLRRPLEREPELVRDDVLSGFVSFERAREVYGVAFVREEADDSLELDREETKRLREARRRQ